MREKLNRSSQNHRFCQFGRLGLVVICAVAISSCATAKRFAPPGFVKYEDKAKGIPPNATIQQRIDERAALGKADGNAKAKYPDLSQTPSVVPVGIDPAMKAAQETTLLQARDGTEKFIGSARRIVAAEFGVDANGQIIDQTLSTDPALAARLQALEEQLAQDRLLTETEAREPLPEPLDIVQTPKPKEPF